MQELLHLAPTGAVEQLVLRCPELVRWTLERLSSSLATVQAVLLLEPPRAHLLCCRC